MLLLNFSTNKCLDEYNRLLSKIFEKNRTDTKLLNGSVGIDFRRLKYSIRTNFMTSLLRSILLCVQSLAIHCNCIEKSNKYSPSKSFPFVYERE